MGKILTIYVLAFLMVTSTGYAGDCENAVSTVEMRFCSAKTRKEAEQKFSSSLDRLEKSYDGDALKKVKLNFERQKLFAEEACSSLFPNGSAAPMYINYCVSFQLDLLSKSARHLACDQMTGEGCN